MSAGVIPLRAELKLVPEQLRMCSSNPVPIDLVLLVFSTLKKIPTAIQAEPSRIGLHLAITPQQQHTASLQSSWVLNLGGTIL